MQMKSENVALKQEYIMNGINSRPKKNCHIRYLESFLTSIVFGCLDLISESELSLT